MGSSSTPNKVKFESHIQSRQVTRLLVVVGIVGFSLSRWFRRERLKDFFWDILKFELYYVAGGCANSGMCCQSLTLVKAGNVVRDRSVFDAMVLENPRTYSRFMPVLGREGEIHHFSCECLTPERTCNDYENRPRFCQQYPISAFVKDGVIRQGCGYSVQLKGKRPRVWDSALRERMLDLERSNRLS